MQNESQLQNYKDSVYCKALTVEVTRKGRVVVSHGPFCFDHV